MFDRREDAPACSIDAGPLKLGQKAHQSVLCRAAKIQGAACGGAGGVVGFGWVAGVAGFRFGELLLGGGALAVAGAYPLPVIGGSGAGASPGFF